MARGRSLLAIVVTVAVGAAVAAAGGSGGARVGPISLFAWCTALAFVVNWLAFVPSYRAQTEVYFDLTGSITYLTVVVVALTLGGASGTRSWVLAALIVVWAGRLGSFLFRRVRAEGRDGRFSALKTDWASFLMVWTLQGLWVTFTIAAALAALSASVDRAFGLVGVAGVLVWIVGFSIEVAADRQKSAFRSDVANEGKFIDVGLWAWSRHPNYLGEIILWLGIAIVAAPALAGWRLVTLLSPVFVVVLLTRISGIPLLERRADRRWGHDPRYQQYRARTPALLLRPPRGS